MLRANAVDERYLTSYTAYRTSGGLAPGGGLRHAASGSEMCFCVHPRSASAHVRTPPSGRERGAAPGAALRRVAGRVGRERRAERDRVC